ncbi:MAG: hypothetical protein ABI171_18750 [Collimonas sp.]|uniref:hypothetical protein n=1 Tax=Collimonas sp. TaxID=1963772 RepID=UPI003264A652
MTTRAARLMESLISDAIFCEEWERICSFMSASSRLFLMRVKIAKMDKKAVERESLLFA